VAPSDLCALVELCIRKNKENSAFDVYSAKPARESELIALFKRKCGLETQVDETSLTSATGTKLASCSCNRTAGRILKYAPQKHALDSVKHEVDSLIAASKKG
jgi:hypothetical protein